MKITLKKMPKIKKIKLVHKEQFGSDSPIEDLKLTLRMTRALKRAKIDTVGQLLLLTLTELNNSIVLGAGLTYTMLEYLAGKGLYLKDYDKEIYSNIDEYIIDNLRCKDCGAILRSDSNPKTQRCKKCDEKAQRREQSVKFELDISEPYYDVDLCDCEININITNISNAPLKIAIKEISVFSEDRQHNGKINCNEEYALPDVTRTVSVQFASNEHNIELKESDYITAVISDVKTNISYCFVYTLDADKSWIFTDYFEYSEE